MMAQVLFYRCFFEKDPQLNAVEFAMVTLQIAINATFLKLLVAL